MNKTKKINKLKWAFYLLNAALILNVGYELQANLVAMFPAVLMLSVFTGMIGAGIEDLNG